MPGECESIRTPDPTVGRELALRAASLPCLEHLAACFVVDARHFLQTPAPALPQEEGGPTAAWPRLASLVLTSQALVPGQEEDTAKVDALLRAAAAAAARMPRLETLEIWNGRKGLAALFQYRASRATRRATITWRGTWDLDLATRPGVRKAWGAAVKKQHGDSWMLTLVQERLDPAAITSHGEAIHHLRLSGEVIRPVSLRQTRVEQKVLEAAALYRRGRWYLNSNGNLYWQDQDEASEDDSVDVPVADPDDLT